MSDVTIEVIEAPVVNIDLAGPDTVLSAAAAARSDASADLAEKWANEDEDVVVAGGEYSAKHYVAKAADEKTAAAASATAAAASAASAAAEVADILTELSGVVEIVGEPTPATGTGLGAGTRVFATPVSQDGQITKVQFWVQGVGVVKVRRFTRSGSTFTYVPGQTVLEFTNLSTGILQSYDIPPGATVLAGEYLGYYAPSSAIGITGEAATSGGWFFGTGDVTTNFTDADGLPTATALQIGIHISAQTVTAEALDDVEARVEVLEAQEGLGELIQSLSDVVEIIGAPEPVSGTNYSARTIVWAQPVAQDGWLSLVDLYAKATGTVKVKRFTKSGDTFTYVPGQTEVVLTVGSTGPLDWDIPYGTAPVLEGEYIGFHFTANVVGWVEPAVSGGWYNGTGDVTTTFDASVATQTAPQIGFHISAQVVTADIAGGAPNVLTIQNADKIAVNGNSLMAGAYVPRDKVALSKLSMMSDFNVESFSISGQTYRGILGRIRDGSIIFGSRSWKDYGVTYALLIQATNDDTYGTFAEYLDDIRGTCETVRGTGAIPIVATEHAPDLFGPGNEINSFQVGLRAIAEEQGGYFLNLLPHARTYDPDAPTGRDLELWGLAHPGVRTNDLFAVPLERFFRSLPRPRQSLKIFRQRPGVSVSTPADLMYDTYFDRARLFKEISIGHLALTAATEKYMDELATHEADFVNETVNSEYLALDAGSEVEFADDYGCIDAILPGTQWTIDDLTLVLSDPDITVYVRDVLAAPYENYTRYHRFWVATPTVVVGATYTSDDADLPEVFTVVGLQDGNLIMSPMAAVRALQGGGTLTRTSGTGDASISYTAAEAGAHPDYYANLGLPEGNWVEVEGVDGRYEITDLRGRLQFDRVQFLLYKSGGFSLTDVQIEWNGLGGKSNAPRPAYDIPKLGTEILAETRCGDAGELAGWTVNGSLTPGAHADDLSDPPLGSVGYVTVTDANTLEQTLTFTSDPINDREIWIKVVARRHAEMVDSATYPTGASITADTFDLSKLRVELAEGDRIYPMHDHVGLWWKDCWFRSMLPANETSLTITVTSTGDEIDVAEVSVKPLA